MKQRDYYALIDSGYNNARQSALDTPLGVRMAKGGSELMLYGEIGWDIYSEDVIDTLRDLESVRGDLTVRINSPGGALFEGMAIFNALKQHPRTVVAQVDGIAASAASIIALSGERLLMGEGTYFMIHDPWSVVLGNADTLRKEAGVLDMIADDMAGIYAKRSGKTSEDTRALMREETWFTAAGAVENGFAAGIVGADSEAAEVTSSFDLSKFGYRHPPQELLARFNSGGSTGLRAMRGFEKALRDVGLSRSEARMFISAGKRGLTQRDADEDLEQFYKSCIGVLNSIRKR